MSFQQALSGLNVASKNLDVIGNNVANSSTVGFKSGEAQFADVFAASLAGAGASPIGLGAKLAGVAQQFTQGNITATNNPLDMAINGSGFFIVSPAGTTTPYYSRNGQFSLDKDSYIVNSEGYRVQGYQVDSSGVVQPGTAGDLLVSKATIAAVATGASSTATGVLANVNLNAGDPSIASAFNYQDPTTYNHSTALSLFDSQGNAHTYTMYFQKAAANSWKVYATVSNPAGASTPLTNLGQVDTLAFSTTGALVPPAIAAATVTSAQLGYGGTVNNLGFNLNFSGSTQYGSAFAVNSLSQDGYSSGQLAGFTVNSDGIIKGAYTNGQTKNLGQFALANFANPQGLQAQGNNMWAASSSSGVALNNQPGTGGNGVIQSSATEDSNVDLTGELVNMITAQRVYQANAQTIKTEDAIMQTLVNLR